MFGNSYVTTWPAQVVRYQVVSRAFKSKWLELSHASELVGKVQPHDSTLAELEDCGRAVNTAVDQLVDHSRIRQTRWEDDPLLATLVLESQVIVEYLKYFIRFHAFRAVEDTK